MCDISTPISHENKCSKDTSRPRSVTLFARIEKQPLLGHESICQIRTEMACNFDISTLKIGFSEIGYHPLHV